MQIIKFGLDGALATALVEGVALGEYNLLLGAGFSAGAIGGDNTPLPGSWQLASDLNDRYKLGASPEELKSLHNIYEDAIYSARGKADVLSYLRQRFLGTHPSWQGAILDFDWQRIWTLNIDDVLEQASLSDSSRRWAVESLGRASKLAAPDRYSMKLQLIHLHGRAKSIQGENSDLVFSLPEYSNFTKGSGDWLSEFWSNWLQRPFLVIGAKLLEESDLAGALDRGTESARTTGYATVAVLASASPREKQRLARKGIVVVEASGQDFVSALAEDVKQYFLDRPALTAGLTKAQLVAFNGQFEILDRSMPAERDGHDFFAGDEPFWRDILMESDAILATTRACSDYLAVQERLTKVVLLSGRPGAGRSTALLRLAEVELSRSRSVALFRGDRELDVGAAIEWIRARPRSTLFFDNGANHSDKIGRLIQRIGDEQIEASIVVAERSSRVRAVISDLGEATKQFKYGIVSKADVHSIVAKRREVGRLGVGTSWNDSEWMSHFLKRHDGDLFSALSEIEGGGGFYGRMDAEVRKLAASSNLRELRLLLAIAIVHRLGFSLPIRSAKLILRGGGAEDSHALFETQLTQLIEFDRTGVRLRHRMLADRFIKNFSDAKDRYQVSLSIVRSLGVLVTTKSMGEKSYDYLVLRALMDQEHVLGLLENVANARTWYADLADLFDWNGRYWDQRALLESSGGNDPAAYSFAKRSVSLHRHPFALTTLGAVRCRAAANVAATSEDQAIEFFKEGNAALLEGEALARSRGNQYEHPFVTFYTTALDLLERLAWNSPKRVLLDRMRQDWERAANLRPSGSPIRRIVEVKGREWIRRFIRSGRERAGC